MKKHPIQVALLLCLFGCGTALTAADEQGNPLADLLGKELDQVRHRFLFVVDDNDRKDPHCDIHHCPDFNLWFVLDKKRRYMSLMTVDGTITKISARDNLVPTAKGIRVGDTFSKVQSMYPDASFRWSRPEKAFSGLLYVFLTADKKTEFWFIDRDIEQMVSRGENVELSGEIVQNMKVHSFHVEL